MAKTYEDLVSDIGSWLARDDMSARIPDFIKMAEAEIRRIVESSELEAVDYILYVTAGDESAALPADFKRARTVMYASKVSSGPGWVPGDPIPMDMYSPSQLRTKYYAEVAGIPVAYTIIGQYIKFAPAAGEDCFLLIDYEPYLAELSAGALPSFYDSNYDLLMYGALKHSAPFLVDDGRVQVWDKMFKESVSQYNLAQNKRRWGGSQPAPQYETEVY